MARLRLRICLSTLALLLSACRDLSVAPTSKERLVRFGSAISIFEPDENTEVDSLIREVTIDIPAGVSSGYFDLVIPGEISGPKIIEVVGTLALQNGTIPISTVMGLGNVLWFRHDTALVYREIGVVFTSRDTLGHSAYEPFLSGEFTDSTRVKFSPETLPGLRVEWSTSNPSVLGFPSENGSPGYDPECILQINWGCIGPTWIPPISSSTISVVPPTGSIRIRVYGIRSKRLQIQQLATGLLKPTVLEYSVKPCNVSAQSSFRDIRVTLSEVRGESLTAIAGRVVTAELEAIALDGGHAHGGVKPTGDFSETEVA